jgi:hypothetical protein
VKLRVPLGVPEVLTVPVPRALWETLSVALRLWLGLPL